MNEMGRKSMKNVSILVRAAMILICLILPLGETCAQGGGATEEEVKQMVQNQFERMYQTGVENASGRITKNTGVKPFAVVIGKSDKVRVVRIKQAEEMPADVALSVLRRSLVALVKNGAIGSSAVFYTTDNPSQESDTDRVLIAEMEHIFGPNLAQLVPYEVNSGSVKFGKPVTLQTEKYVFNFATKKSSAED